MSDKLNKFLVVIFLTLLIWAWAYMSIKQSHSFTGTLEVLPSTDPSLLVTLTLQKSNPQTKIPLTSLNFTGAPSRISDLRNRYNRPPANENREQLDFYYDPQEHKGIPGEYPLDILGYLQNNSKVHELALTLESCTPSQATVKIEQLVEKELPIQCVDKDGLPLKGANPDPPFVRIFVRKGYNDSATVVLTPQQIETARQQKPVSVRPYVNLGVAGATRESANQVNVTLQSEMLLQPRAFQTTKPIGIIMSQELQNTYKVTILNDEELRKTTTIYATDEAFRAYESVAYPLYITVKDSDVVDLAEIAPKMVYYNFPQEYVKAGQIEQDETKLPRSAVIKIEPLSPVLTP